MIATEPVVVKKLKIKFSSQRVDTAPGISACESGHDARKNCHSQAYDTQNAKQDITVCSTTKRGPVEMAEEGQLKKKRKMDHSAVHQCILLVKSLIKHPCGWVFKEPVDPISLDVPDYFSIISSPMDLGTVKSKLENSQYFGAEDFAADVRLTFSNAMLYNPPSNSVHMMAVKLKKVFETRWKALEKKWNDQTANGGDLQPLGVRHKGIGGTRPDIPETALSHNNALPNRSKPSEDVLQSCSSDVRAAEVKRSNSKPVEICNRKVLHHNSFKGTDNGGTHTTGSVNVKPSSIPVGSKCGTCRRSVCQCMLPSDSTHASSDISSERSSGRDQNAHSTDTSKQEVQGKRMLTSQMCKSDPDSDGAVSALDEENTCPSSQLTTPSTDANSEEGWRAMFDVQLSPTKALRAAMLRRRFADTILKAQHKTLLEHGNRADPVKLQQEKERLEKKQLEEKAWIEAQIRAAEAASRKREETELKKQREKEREAARLALQQMEKSAEIEQNVEIVKELEKLSGCSLSYSYSFGRKGPQGKVDGADSCIPLERFGLFIKDDIDDVDDDDEISRKDEEDAISRRDDEEEGEIFP